MEWDKEKPEYFQLKKKYITTGVSHWCCWGNEKMMFKQIYMKGQNKERFAGKSLKETCGMKQQ